MNYKNGVKNIFWSILGQVITFGFGILIPKLIIESYGSDVNGLLSSVGTIISYLALLEAGVGAVTCQSLYKPVSDNDRNGINGILSATNYYYKRAGSYYLLLVVIISFVYPLVISSSLSYPFVAAIIFIHGIPGVINFLFQRKYITFLESLGKNYIFTNLQTFLGVLTSLLKVVLLQMNCSVIAVQLVYCLISISQMIFVLIYIKKKYPWINLKVEPDLNSLSQKNPALIHQICSLITNSTDVVVLSIFCNLQTVSIYSMYNMVFNIVNNIVESAFGGVKYILGQSYCRGKDYYCRIIDSYETVFIMISGFTLLTSYIMIDPFLSIYTKNADINYVNPGCALLFFLVKIMNAFRVSATNTISVSGNFEGSKNHSIIEALLNLSISLISVLLFGLPGVLFGTIVAFLYRCVVSIIYANRDILGRSCRHSVKIILGNAALSAIGMLFFYFIKIRCDNYLSFFITGITIAVVLMVVFAVFNILLDIKSFRIIKSFVVSKFKTINKKT